MVGAWLVIDRCWRK